MKAWELVNMLESLPPDANIDILHVIEQGTPRAFSVVNVSEDQLGAHLIVESKRKLRENAMPECGICGKKLRNPKTRKELGEQMYCHPPMMLRTCWDEAAEV
jgi:hypothetical protein